MVELHDHRSLDKRSGGQDPVRCLHRAGKIAPLLDEAVVAEEEMGVKTDHFPLKFPLEACHDRHDQDQHRDAEGHPNHGNQRDHGEKRPLRLEIAGR